MTKFECTHGIDPSGLTLCCAHACRNRTCLSGNNECKLCEPNPHKRCQPRSNFALKQEEDKQLVAACRAPIKLALRASDTGQEQNDPNAASTSGSQSPVDLPSAVVIEVSFAFTGLEFNLNLDQGLAIHRMKLHPSPRRASDDSMMEPIKHISAANWLLFASYMTCVAAACSCLCLMASSMQTRAKA